MDNLVHGHVMGECSDDYQSLSACCSVCGCDCGPGEMISSAVEMELFGGCQAAGGGEPRRPSPVPEGPRISTSAAAATAA